MKNKYIHHSHISERKFREIVKCFEHDFTSQETAGFTGISRVTVGKLFIEFRKRILTLEDELPVEGEIELDESYFGPRRVRGKRGRGAGSKIPVFGIIKRGDKVFTKVVNNCSREELLPIIKGQVLEGSDIYTDGWRAYDGLILDGYKHYRIHHHENEFEERKESCQRYRVILELHQKKACKVQWFTRISFCTTLERVPMEMEHESIRQKHIPCFA